MEHPLEVISRVRSASLGLGSDAASAFAAPGGPLRASHVRAARADLEQRARATFFAERWATQPVAARARVIWRGWAQGFAGSLRWEQAPSGEIAPRMRERLDELTSLLSGPATRGELRVLDAYEAYFQVLFTLGWAAVVRADPAGDARRLPGPAIEPPDLGAGAAAWSALVAAWTAPWEGRRRHDDVFGELLRWVDPPRPHAIASGREDALP
ncbi:MAG TPA: hypothetical protein VG370_11580 [Chloroflexota bacterium]|nr:hypothetical protein [Chloroflexota bacterium]